MSISGESPPLRDRLLQSEERFRLLFEDAPVAYHEIDRTGRIMRINRAECAMLGYDRSELIGKGIWEIVSPEDQSRIRSLTLQKLAGSARLTPFQARFMRRDGTPVTVGLYENLIEDESGAIVGMRGILVNVSEREQTIEALFSSELKYRDLFDNVIDGVYQSGPDGRILTANPALLQMLGYISESEFLETAGGELSILPEFRAVREGELERHGELRNCELKLRAKDGRLITVLENARAVRDPSGVISYYEGTLTNVTGRVQAQQELTEERDFTSAIIDAAGSLIVVLDPNGRIIRFNRACEQISGYSFEEVRGLAFWDILIIPEEVAALKDIFARLRERSESIKHENHWATRSGELRLFDWSNVPLRDKLGATAYIISTGLDITERRRAERALRASEQRYRDLFENANDIVYTHDLRGAFTSINTAAERITGYNRSEAMKMNIAEILAPEYTEIVRQGMESKLGGDGPTTFEFDIISKSGKRVSLEVSTRLQLENGQPIGIHGVARDITDRKVAEEKLESYARELARKNDELASALAGAKEATELKSRFLATMSHEIRTPMNGIAGMTDLLISTRLDAEQLEYAQAVRHSAEALLTVINDILDISKIEAGKLRLDRTIFDPRAVIEEVIDLLAPRAAVKGLRLECEAQRELPRIILGDSGRLRQILLNLIGNAVKFTDEGEVSVTATLAGLSADRAYVHFSVCDTGIGISPENCAHLFESFVQGDSSTTRKYGGTGLGLAISKQLVEMMGGKIEVESELGSGATFRFEVPFERYVPEDSLKDCRALVVDEDTESAAVTGEYLRLLGCRSDAATRSEALAKLREAAAAGDPFAIVLFDMSSPGAEFSALNEAIASDRAISGLLRIGCCDSPIRGDSGLRTFGFAGILQKPIDPALLHDTLIAALEERGGGA
jgi:PAS domain S-box-containing protein